MNKKLLAYKRVLILGLGRYPEGSGVMAAKVFAQCGAELRITDLLSEKELAKPLKKLSRIKAQYILGKHRREDIDWADLIMRNPGVPHDAPHVQYARKKGIPVKTDVSLLMELVRNPIIGVTGTRGKSSTASIVHQLLLAAKKKALLGGNIGKSLLKDYETLRPAQPLVIEMSSFMTESLTPESGSPKIAILTNLYPDHLNVYTSLRKYYAAKARIFAYQKKTDIAIISKDQRETRRLASRVRSRLIWVSLKPVSRGEAVFVRKRHVVMRLRNHETALFPVDDIPLSGEHQIHNVLCAVAAARMMRVPVAAIRKIVTKLEPLEGRLEHVKTIRGVTFVNDTMSSMPVAAVQALRTFSDNRILWICGGNDKDVSYLSLRAAARKAHMAFVLPGTAKKKLHNVIPAKKRVDVRGMAEAFRRIKKMAQPGDVVLLSPAATSFAQYANVKERGKDFIAHVKKFR